MLLACKYEEIYPPEVKDFVYITDRAYTKEDVLQMEFLILSALQFDLTFPTALRFFERYLKNLAVGDNDQDLSNLSQFLIELALIDVRMLQYPSSIIAAAALCQALRTMARVSQQGQESERYVEILIRQHFSFLREKSEVLLRCCKEL